MNEAYVEAEAGRRRATPHPVSDAAIAAGWPQFIANVRSRLEIGAQAYGDGSFNKPAGQLAVEIEQELDDVMGWGFILWSRVQVLKAKLTALEAAAQPVHVQTSPFREVAVDSARLQSDGGDWRNAPAAGPQAPQEGPR